MPCDELVFSSSSVFLPPKSTGVKRDHVVQGKHSNFQKVEKVGKAGWVGGWPFSSVATFYPCWTLVINQAISLS